MPDSIAPSARRQEIGGKPVAQLDTSVQRGRPPFRLWIWWLALLVLVVNDHLLKGGGWLSAAWTGKLSDVAGLIVAPPALARLIGARGRGGSLACVLATGIVFTLVNLSPEAARAVERLTAAFGLPWQLWPDPTDLLALPALYAAWRLLGGGQVAPRGMSLTRTWPASPLHGISAALAGLACLATSYVPPRSPEEVQSTESEKLFVMSFWKDHVLAIDPRTGTVLGSRELKEVAHSSWVAAGDTLYFADSDEGVLALEMRSPGVRFRTTIHCRHCPMRLTLGRKQVFVLLLYRHLDGGDGWVFAVDRTSGEVDWYVPVADLTDFSPSESDRAVFHRDHLLLPTQGGLASLASATGTLEILGPRARIEWLKVDEGTAYFVAHGSEGAELIELDLDSKRISWRRPIQAPYAATRYAGDALGVSGDVLIHAEEGELLAFDRSTKHLLWRHPHAGEMAIGSRIVVLASRRLEPRYESCFRALDARTGEALWTLDRGGDLHDPTFAGDLLLMHAGTALRAYGQEDGRLLWGVDLKEAP